MERIFLDANIFIYFATDKEPYADRCQKLFEKMENEEILGFTSVLVLNEVIHKLMILEIAENKNIEPNRVMQHVRDDQSILGTIKETWKDLLRILSIKNLTILDNEFLSLISGANISMNHNLLISDSMHIASMILYGIDKIATTDSKLKGLKGIRVWDPSESDFSE